MNRKTFSILVVIALVAVLLAVVGQIRSGSDSIAGASAGSLLLPGLADDVEAIDNIEIAGAGGVALVSLERRADGWVVLEQDGYPAATAIVNGVLIDLSEARIVEEKTANPDFHARLGVESIDSAEATGIELRLGSGDGPSHAVVLGGDYGAEQSYARRTNEALSFLIDRAPAIEREPSAWVQREIVAIDGSRIASVTITHADGERLEILKASPDDINFGVADIPEGRELQYPDVANVTGNVLQDLQLDAVAARTSDSAEPVVVSEFRTFDGLVISVAATVVEDQDPWLSFSADAESAAARTEADTINTRLGDWRFRIPAYQYSPLTRRIDDLLSAATEMGE